MHTEAASPLSINYDSPKSLKAFLEGEGLGMRKKFGQNFLINPVARTRLLDSLEIKKGDRVWEIGPGLGAMTGGLLERGANVTAFEIDPAFSRVLKTLFAREKNGPLNQDENCAIVNKCECPSFRLIEGDVLKTWPSVDSSLKNNTAAGPGPVVGLATFPCRELYLLGNLPYNIAAALLADFIEKERLFTRMVVTVQREVAARMAAKPGSSDYSSFSVLCASVYKVTLLQIIKSSSFYPQPRVDSQGVRFDLLTERKVLSKLFNPLVRSLFSSRRKTIRNTLSAFAASVIMGRGKSGNELAAEVLRNAGISGDRRPETLDTDEFNALATILEGYGLNGK